MLISSCLVPTAFAVAILSFTSLATASGRPPCYGQCMANAQMKGTLEDFRRFGTPDYNQVYQGKVTGFSDAGTTIHAYAVGYYAASEIDIFWSRAASAHLRLVGRFDSIGNLEDSIVNLGTSVLDVRAQAILPAPNPGFTFAPADSAHPYFNWDFAWFELNDVALVGSTPVTVSVNMKKLPIVNVDTLLALEEAGQTFSAPLAGHIVRGSTTSIVAVSSASPVRCGVKGAFRANWTATLTIPNDNIANATASTPVLSTCQ